MKPSVSAIVPVHNERETLPRVLDSILRALAAVDGELIVVDHESTDGSRELLRDYADRATVLRKTGGTVSAVRNLGAKHAAGTVLCFIDADCVVGSRHFERLLEILEETGAAAAGCRVRPPEGAGWVDEIWHSLHARKSDGYRVYINAGNFAVSREAFEAVGGFDEKLGSGEDPDIGRRLNAKGFRLYENAALEAIHLDTVTSLGEFHRKELLRVRRWFRQHGLSLRDSATLLGVWQAAALLLALSALLLVGSLWVSLASALAILAGGPLLLVCYRQIQAGEVIAPLRSLLLYSSYFTARGVAIVEAVGSRIIRFLREHRGR